MKKEEGQWRGEEVKKKYSQRENITCLFLSKEIRKEMTNQDTQGISKTSKHEFRKRR